MKNTLQLLFCGLVFVGCATDMKDQFQLVQVGMEKNDVLALMDSPQRTQRWHGKDRWTYIYYDNDSRIEKEVHFLEGKAEYVGDTYKPEISAEEQDAKNEAANREVEALIQARQEETRKSYMDYENRVKTSDAVHYVPQYAPVPDDQGAK